MISRKDYRSGTTKYPDFGKRYYFGVIAQYYPCGFLDDIDATCDTIDELRELIEEEKDSWGEWIVCWDSIDRIYLDDLINEVHNEGK